MAMRRVSPGAKVAVFLVAIVALAGAAFLGWNALKSAMPPSGSDLPEQVVAGESFAPGETVEIFGTKTEAILDGVTQKVQAADPSEEWKTALDDVTCNDSNVCTALAPDSAAGGDGEGGGGFMGTGMSLGMLAGGLIFGWILYVILTEEN